jgi:hypothetical protein
MVLRREENQIGDMCGRRSLRFLCVAQACSGGAYRFVLTGNSVPVQRGRREMVEQ